MEQQKKLVEHNQRLLDRTERSLKQLSRASKLINEEKTIWRRQREELKLELIVRKRKLLAVQLK